MLLKCSLSIYLLHKLREFIFADLIFLALDNFVIVRLSGPNCRIEEFIFQNWSLHYFKWKKHALWKLLKVLIFKVCYCFHICCAGIVTICPVDVAVQKKVNVTCAFGNEPFRDNFRIALVRKTNSSYEEGMTSVIIFFSCRQK